MDNKINVADNITLLLTVNKRSYTLNQPTESIITAKEDSGATKTYCRDQDSSILLDVQHTMNVTFLQITKNKTISTA